MHHENIRFPGASVGVNDASAAPSQIVRECSRRTRPNHSAPSARLTEHAQASRPVPRGAAPSSRHSSMPSRKARAASASPRSMCVASARGARRPRAASHWSESTTSRRTTGSSSASTQKTRPRVVLASLARFDGSLADKVGSAFTTRSGSDRAAALWSALSPMADRGMILVPLPFAEGRESETDACRRMGKRVAEVVGWVTHARSHHHHHHH